MPGNPRRVLPPGPASAAMRRLEDYVRALERRIGAGGGGGTSSSDDVSNESGVAGASVTDALDALEAEIAALVIPDSSDDIANDSGVSGTTVSDALDTLEAEIPVVNAGDEWQLTGNVSLVAGRGVVLPRSVEVGAHRLVLEANSRLEVKADQRPGNIWTPDGRPGIPSQWDDECNGVTLDAKWGTWNAPGGFRLLPEPHKGQYRLTIEATGFGYAGIYQAVPPGGEFCIYAKLIPQLLSSASGVGSGIWVGQDVASNPTTADFRLVEFSGATSAFNVRTATLDAYNGSASSSTSITNTYSPYFRLRVLGTSVRADLSFDGLHWRQMDTNVLGFTPSHMGVAITKTAAADVFQSRLHFFRVYAGPGTADFLFSPEIGGLV